MEKSDPKKLDKLLSSHFVTIFLLDVLGFCYAYFFRAKNICDEVPEKKFLYDHRKPVCKDQDGFKTCAIEIEPIVPTFDVIMLSIIDGLDSVWANPFNILKFWSIKHDEDPTKGRGDRSNEDSYSRTFTYDGQGVAVFCYFNLKEQIDTVFSNDKKNMF